MNNQPKLNRVIKMAVLLSGVAAIYPLYAQLGGPANAQESGRDWGTVDARNAGGAIGRVDYFANKLRPHAPIAYSSEEYHKTIVRLNWFDEGERRSTIVNLKRTFDIYGLFEGDSITLGDHAKAILDDLGTAINSEGINTRMYAIAGHSVVKGQKGEDQELSEKRAKVVKAYLQENFNISDERLRPVGFGTNNLKDKENASSEKNNRIELCLIEHRYQRKPAATVQLPDVEAEKARLVSTAAADTEDKPASRPLLKYERELARLQKAEKAKAGETKGFVAKTVSRRKSAALAERSEERHEETAARLPEAEQREEAGNELPEIPAFDPDAAEQPRERADKRAGERREYRPTAQGERAHGQRAYVAGGYGYADDGYDAYTTSETYRRKAYEDSFRYGSRRGYGYQADYGYKAGGYAYKGNGYSNHGYAGYTTRSLDGPCY